MAYLYIDRDECIGDSLVKINTNAYNFDQLITTNTGNLSALTTVVQNTSAGVVVFEERKPANINAGKALRAWNIRALSNKTYEYPPSLNASINSITNTFTLPKGTWWIKISAPAYQVGRHQARLLNFNSGTPIAVGTSEYCPKGTTVTNSKLEILYTTDGSISFRVEHFTDAPQGGTNDLGVAVNAASDEIYTTVTCSKIG